MFSKVNIITITIILCTATRSNIEAYKILGLFPWAARSHFNSGSSILKALAEAGHDVSIVACYRDDYIPKSANGSYRELVLTGCLEKQEEIFEDMNLYDYDDTSIFTQFDDVFTMVHMETVQLFENRHVQKLIHSNATFDAVIIDEFFYNPLKGLPAHFKAHQILINSVPTNNWVNHLMGNPSLPSFSSDVFLQYPARMSFRQRLYTTLFTIYLKCYQHLVLYPEQERLMKKYIPNAVDFYEALYNASFLFYDGHTSITNAEPVVPNMLGVAGMHIKGPKELPKDLKEFLDNSKNGVVYFSFGSIANTTDLPIAKRNIILNSLGSLKEDVLMKWEDDDLPDKPKNVRLGKWLPQESILAHPNVKLFVTHGGFLSTLETIYYGVPIVAVPLFFDQITNAERCENDGFARFVRYRDLSEEKLTSLINEVLSNPEYRDNVKYRSDLLRDRQTHPLQDTVYWVEYIIRHNGARHLRVATMDMAWYQYYLLDVFGFTALVTVLLFILIQRLFQYSHHRCNSNKISGKKHKLN